MKQIHFYSDLTNEEQTSEKDLDSMYVDFVTTMRAIDELSSKESGTVKTTQLELLRNNQYFIDRGIDVFIHIREEVFRVKPGCDLNKLLYDGERAMKQYKTSSSL